MLNVCNIVISLARNAVGSDVKRGQNFEAKAKISRPRPELRGRGQSYKAVANFWRLRPRLRPKIIMKKLPNNN